MTSVSHFFCFLTGIRRSTMVRHATRQAAANSWDDDGVCPNIIERLKVLKKDSRLCHAYPAGNGEFEIHDGKSHLAVSLNLRTCGCGAWQISGIPCKHAIRAILFANREPANYVSEWFSVRRYKEAYSMPIHPIPDKEQWQAFDVPSLEPPQLKRSIGRPSRNRIREQGEPRKGRRSITVKCRKCGCFGHNSKTCKGGYTAKEAQERQGTIPATKKRAKRSLGDCSTSNFASLDELEASVMASTPTATQTQTQDTQGAPSSTQEAAQTSTKGKKRKTTDG